MTEQITYKISKQGISQLCWGEYAKRRLGVKNNLYCFYKKPCRYKKGTGKVRCLFDGKCNQQSLSPTSMMKNHILPLFTITIMTNNVTVSNFKPRICSVEGCNNRISYQNKGGKCKKHHPRRPKKNPNKRGRPIVYHDTEHSKARERMRSHYNKKTQK